MYHVYIEHILNQLGEVGGVALHRSIVVTIDTIDTIRYTVNTA